LKENLWKPSMPARTNILFLNNKSNFILTMLVFLYQLSPTPASLLITHVTQYPSILTLLYLSQ
jgi:hypothetical protein